MNEEEKIHSRREFARKAALFSVAVPLASASALAENHPEAQKEDQQLPKLPPDFPKLSEQSRAEVEARYEAIVKQYSGRFSTEQRAELRRLSYIAQPQIDRLRAYALENGDGPALYLKPAVEREKKPVPAVAKKP